MVFVLFKNTLGRPVAVVGSTVTALEDNSHQKPNTTRILVLGGHSLMVESAIDQVNDDLKISLVQIPSFYEGAQPTRVNPSHVAAIDTDVNAGVTRDSLHRTLVFTDGQKISTQVATGDVIAALGAPNSP